MLDAPCWTAADREMVLAEIATGLWRYVASRARTVRLGIAMLADLTGLSEDDLATLRHLHLLLSDDVHRFIAQALPVLLDDVRPRVRLDTAVQRAEVRGRIAWGATVAARARHGGTDAALFVVATPRQSFDTPEARLLVQLLHGLAASCTHLRVPVDEMPEPSWTLRVVAIEAAVERALRHHRVARLEPAGAGVPADLAACRRSKRIAVRLLAQAYERYRQLVAEPSVAALVDAFARRALAPLSDDVLYELWALIGAAEVFTTSGWTLAAAGLAGRSKAPFTYLAPDGAATARLWFGHAPARWRRASRYRTVFDRFGLPGAVRRPDLIVEIRAAARRQYLLVEVKRTRDPEYIAESVYKVLGYLADFEPVFAGSTGTRALLLLWEGVAKTAPQAAPDLLVVATHKDYRAKFAVLVAEMSRRSARQTSKPALE